MAGGTAARYRLQAIGRVESPLTDPALAPRQGDEGAPEAWLVIAPAFATGLSDLRPGGEVVLLTWLHLARRDVLAVHPRDDAQNPLTGVFSTRSADRPRDDPRRGRPAPPSQRHRGGRRHSGTRHQAGPRSRSRLRIEQRSSIENRARRRRQ